MAYKVGAVVYHEKVREIWATFGEWFGEQGLDLETVYFESYEDQVAALLAGRLHTAWNTNLAHVHTLAQAGDGTTALAMRDTDRGWRTHIVVRDDGKLTTLDDLAGLRVGFGDADSPQAQILPVAFLRAQGIDPAEQWRCSRLDRDLGKHGDTGGAELAQLARVRAGELDASLLSAPMLDAVGALGDASALRSVWTSPPYHHCCFTVLDGDDPDHSRFRALLASMDPSDPRLCDAMELEYVNEWVDFDPSGYQTLIEAVAEGPIVVGDAG